MTVPTIHFWLCGGNLKEIAEACPIVFDVAKKAGFKRAYVSGRRGWKVLIPNSVEYCTTYKVKL
jgi:hypothetical protein